VADGPPDPPLRVDWVDADALRDGRPGRLGLTFLPGKNGASTLYPGRIYRRNLADDLETLKASGVRRLLLLVEDHELARWGDPAIVERAAAAGLAVERRAIPDGHAPATQREMDEMLAWIAEGREAGDVAVACMGGVGRTGTVAACALVAAGWAADAAIGEVRRVRHPAAVETEAQVQFVAEYAAERRSTGTVAP
jgi:protein-tyrosine phosphatase